MFLILTLIIGLSLRKLYIRYFPIRDIKCVDSSSITSEISTTQIIDVRDYNESNKMPIINALNIPIGYLKRSYKDISNIEIHIVASNKLEKNLGIRFLRKKGFKIIGYSLTTCDCK
ncbi:hypothetical protein [Bacillus sp. UNCCL81]|uniref:hypothetical protein n=1 Tax=Bacillus sp. UNCCL81 TaxID=1502755 RepID=UPI00047285B8|nr:hypothetical protein [Bacillus sp. UNCCL81]SFC37199.1 hypothetical protein SAMN02799633_00611 [Bacillus sp. UNCCL81]